MKKTALPPLEGDKGQELINLPSILGMNKDDVNNTAVIESELSKAFKKSKTISVQICSDKNDSLQVSLGDKLTGIIPRAEIDPDHNVALAGFVGTEVRVKIIGLDLDKKEVVFSRKKARIEDAEQLLVNLKTGDRIKGIVKVLLPYGCFVELGGIAGLLKDKEITHRPIRAMDIFQVGQSIEVEIKEITKNKRIYLSTKFSIPKPGPEAYEKFIPGTHHLGKVISVHKFGVFVSIDNVEALCSLPKTGRVRAGQDVTVKINQVIPEEGKLHGIITKFLN